MADTQANDVILLQQVLIDNLDKLGFRSITANKIGDREGVPDGILGNGTSTALHTLAIMAQIEAGVEPDKITTGYNEDSAPLVTAYVEKYAGPEAAAQFSGSIKSVFPSGEFNRDYDEATLDTDNVSRELNVAEFRRLGEGAVAITEGTPPPAQSAAPLNDQVKALQEVIFTGNILANIGMEANQVGNYQTGAADGILGKGSSEAFQKLVILSERAAGRDGEEITGVYDADLVKTYLEANGVTAEDATKFVSNAGELNGSLQTLYAATAVDPATVRLSDNGTSVADANVDGTVIETPNTDGNGDTEITTDDNEIVVTTTAPILGPVPFAAELDGVPDFVSFEPFTFGPSPTALGAPFNVAQTTVGISREVVSDPDVRTATLTHKEADQIHDRIGDGVATAQEQLVAIAYDSAKDQRAEQIGLTGKEAEYTKALGRDIYGEQREMYSQANNMRAELKDFKVDVDGQSIALDDVPLTLTLEDGQTVTMTYNQFDENVNDWYDFISESDREQEIRGAMDVAYADLKESSGYTAKEAEMNELNVTARNLPNEHFQQLRELPMEIAGLKRDLRNENIEFVVPSSVTDQQLASIAPSYEPPVEETNPDAEQQTLLAANNP